jgi:hypothetical protein
VSACGRIVGGGYCWGPDTSGAFSVRNFQLYICKPLAKSLPVVGVALMGGDHCKPQYEIDRYATYPQV